MTMEEARQMIDSGGGYKNPTKEDLKQRVTDLEQRLLKSEALLEEYRKLYHEQMRNRLTPEAQEPVQPKEAANTQEWDAKQQEKADDRAFRTLTLKQHATLQMMLRGATNREIARRFAVSEPTAKVYVRGIFQKFGVRDRSEVIWRAVPIFKSFSPEEYHYIAGLPKDWDEKWDGTDAVTATIRQKKSDHDRT